MTLLKTIAVLLSLLAACVFGVPRAAAQCVPLGGFPPDWLKTQETAGGHTLARHVGLSDAQLLARLRNDRRIASASSYTDLATAEAAVSGALNTKAAAINRWAAAARPGATRADDFGPVAVIVGRRADRPPAPANISSRRTFRTVIRATGGGACFLLTSYPT